MWCWKLEQGAKEMAEGSNGGGNFGGARAFPFIAAGKGEGKRRGSEKGSGANTREEAMECSAGAAIERRGRWCRTSGMTPAVIGLWRQGGAGAGMPVVEILAEAGVVVR